MNLPNQPKASYRVNLLLAQKHAVSPTATLSTSPLKFLFTWIIEISYADTIPEPFSELQEMETTVDSLYLYQTRALQQTLVLAGQTDSSDTTFIYHTHLNPKFMK